MYFQIQFLAQDERPVMKLASQGWIQGKEMKTMGNLGVDPRTIYGYRNIPYAEQTSQLRFQVWIVAFFVTYNQRIHQISWKNSFSAIKTQHRYPGVWGKALWRGSHRSPVPSAGSGHATHHHHHSPTSNSEHNRTCAETNSDGEANFRNSF